MAISTGSPIEATEVKHLIDSKISCYQYNVLPQSTTTTTLYALTLIVFFHIFSECTIALVRNEFDNPSGPKSFVHTIKSGSALSISTSGGQLSLTNNSTVGGNALVLAY